MISSITNSVPLTDPAESIAETIILRSVYVWEIASNNVPALRSSSINTQSQAALLERSGVEDLIAAALS